MEIDDFLNKIENGDKIEFEKQKPEIDVILDQLNSKDADKIAVSDKVMTELKSYAEKLKQEKTANESMITKIKQELLEIRNSITSNNLLAAQSSMDNVNTLYEMIPDEFSNDKLDLKKDMTAMESALLSRLVEFHKKDFERKSRIILTSITLSKKYVKEKNPDAAVNEYHRCEEIYKSLPEGFLLEKISVYEMIVELYKEVLIAGQISKLQNRLDS